MNPRKRQAPDPLLPTHRPPKLARKELRASWGKLASDAAVVFQDTMDAFCTKLKTFIPGSSHCKYDAVYPTPPLSPPKSPPSAPPRFRMSSEFQQPHERQNTSEPTASCQTSFKSSDTDGIAHSASTGITSVASTSVQVAQCDPPEAQLAKVMRERLLEDHVQNTLARLPKRRHILDREHKTYVQEKRKEDKQDMLRELHQIECEKKGYTSDIKSLESLLRYQEHLGNRGLTPSRSLTDLRMKDWVPIRSHRHSYPDFQERTMEQTSVSVEFLRRALEKAKRTFKTSPPPPLPFSCHDRLREAVRQKDEAIERRIRPPKVLPPEIEGEVNAILAKRGIVSKIAREQVSDIDLSRLRPSQWLNDEIINFYGAMILSRSETCRQKPRANGIAHQKTLDVHYFSTFFWTKLVNEGYERARLAKWTKKLDIFAKDVVLIPVNHNNSHWTGAAINFRRKRIESYDSMNLDRQLVFEKLHQYLDLEHRNKKGRPFDFTGWVDYDPEDTPQQENGYDCGVFTCQFMESLSRGEQPFKFTQRDMAYFRKRMIWEIAHAKFWDGS
ncbi:hypothetical protein ID866_1370 [Astraeus odoratus]|nr:hypothetical protein ID866_1370 [Astraeus odoratus]